MYTDSPSRLATWMHRKGIARRVSSSYAGAGRWYRCVVDTVLPLRLLANVANRGETARLVGLQRLGRWQWRWTFASKGSR
jgi:hypothetical protein